MSRRATGQPLRKPISEENNILLRNRLKIEIQAAVASGRKLHVARTTGKSPEILKWIIPGVVSFPSQPGAER